MQRLGRRCYGTLVKIWPRDAPAAASSDGPCVYVTGFMTDTTDDDYWESWMPAHQQLLAAPLPWPEQAYGYRWQTGATGDWLGRWPLPVHAAALLARRSSPATLLAAMTADALVNATRCTLTTLHLPHHPRPSPPSSPSPPSPPSPLSPLSPPPPFATSPPHRPHDPSRLLLHYRSAETAAVAEAPGLARACAAFGGDYRVVAHSLGCRLVLEALPLLPAEQRPREVRLHRLRSHSSSTDTATHSRRVAIARGLTTLRLTPRQVHLLVAAATMEAHAARLPQLCAPRAGKVYHYYCADDEALASGECCKYVSG